ncbi:MAG: vitamin B12 dependent-methionine synthase activation domain-containing protein [Dehalococcoidia bacterium]|jgi:hypothetical protein
MPSTDSEIDINKANLLRRIGCSDEYEPSARVESLVDDYIDNYQDFLAPSYTLNYKDILSVSRNKIKILGDVTIKSKVLAILMKKCRKVAVFALTIGPYLEEMVAYLAEKNMVLQATVLDAIGSAAAEKLAGLVQEKIKLKAAEEGLVIGRRFSPGYCDWPVKQQEKVFRLLDGDTAGIRLNESSLMIPQKSVSGVIGIGLPGKGIEEYNPCVTCLKKDCPGRRR